LRKFVAVMLNPACDDALGEPWEPTVGTQPIEFIWAVQYTAGAVHVESKTCTKPPYVTCRLDQGSEAIQRLPVALQATM
jgi:hypothetical protein